MSESELLSHTNEWLNAGVDSITLYLSVLFAYFIVGHLVGKSLTRAQLSVVSVIYSVVMLSGLVTVYVQFTAVDRFVAELIELGSEFITPIPEYTVIIVTGMYAMAFVASHYYMYSRRTRKND